MVCDPAAIAPRRRKKRFRAANGGNATVRVSESTIMPTGTCSVTATVSAVDRAELTYTRNNRATCCPARSYSADRSSKSDVSGTPITGKRSSPRSADDARYTIGAVVIGTSRSPA